MTFIEGNDATVDAIKSIPGLKKQVERIDNKVYHDSVSNVTITDKSIVPVRVVSGNGVTGYTCDIYENGLEEEPTKRGIVFLANGNSTIYVLPAGTIMYAQAIEVSKIGSDD